MDSRNVFLYWTGKDYTLINILRKLIYFHSTNGKGYKVHLITDKNIREYIETIPDYFFNLSPAHQADFVRVHVVCDYGGLWLDSDILILDALDSIFDIIENKNGVFIKENNIICNGMFGSKKQTPLMKEWKSKLIEILNEKKQNIHWTEIGNSLLENLYKTQTNLYDNYTILNGLESVYPVPWDRCIDEFIKKPYENYKNIIRPYQPFIILVNSVYRELENKTEQEILDANMPLNYFLKKSVEPKNIKDNKAIFENIYTTHLWNNNDANIPLSGPGSSLENTRNCSKLLDEFIIDYNCTSVLDLGCGDLTWIPKTNFFNNNAIEYIGIDVVENLINKHSKTYLNKQFYCKDITKINDIKKVSLIIIRDVIFHLTNAEITAIFSNIKNKFDYIAITSCKNNINSDKFNKWFFAEKNIHIEPFNKSYKFEKSIFESNFNRDFHIYTHDNFYN
jgi:hypothetical protein